MKKLLLLFLLIVGFYSFSQLVQVPIYAGKSLQPAQSGNEIVKTYDGDNATIYHSKWSQNGIPDELQFYFTSNITSIKKMVYTPRQSGGTNGMWTKINISYSTQAAPNTFIPVTTI